MWAFCGGLDGSGKKPPRESVQASIGTKNPQAMRFSQSLGTRVFAGAEGLSLACRLGCCSPVGSAQHRPRREPRPVRSRAPLALAHPSARGFGVGVGKRTGGQGRASVGRFLPQVTKRAVLGWCCEKILRVKTGRKARNSIKAPKEIDRKRHGPYNKKRR